MSYVSMNVKDAPHGEDDEAHEHPSERQYIKIAILLSVITFVEVAIYYIDALASILVPALIVLSASKFIFVVSYFMHLKFDDKRLAWIFAAGMILALGIFVSTWALMHYHQIVDYVDRML
jgi:cytochrome c oxidase subunit 4